LPLKSKLLAWLCFAAIAVLAALPLPATTTSPSPPLRVTYELAGEPVVGRRVTLMVEATPGYTYGRESAELWHSANVRIEGNLSWSFDAKEGETERRSWTLVAHGRGPWTVALHIGGGMGEPGWYTCCLYGVSTATDGAAGSEPNALFARESARVSSDAKLDAQANRVDVTYRSEGRGPFWSLGRTVISASASRQDGSSREAIIEPDDPIKHREVSASATLGPDGGFAFTLRTDWMISFPMPPAPGEEASEYQHRADLSCLWHYVKRSDVVGFKQEAVQCGERSPWFIPGPSFAHVGVLVLALALIVRRRLC
jgi:hypothetical protein